MKRVAIIQSNYIPWKGYFDIIHDVDHFILYDDVQYTHGDWRNRNKIKSNNGTSWLTIPLGTHLNKKIYEIELAEHSWQKKHYKSLQAVYSRTPYYKSYKDFLEFIYLEEEWSNLTKLNQFIIKHIAKEFLNINTIIQDSREYEVNGSKMDRLLDLLTQANADTYISGPAAKDYIKEEAFPEKNIKLIYKDYSGYPEYDQIHPPFNHYVTIFDLLFHVGPDTPYYIWGWREEQTNLKEF